MESERVIVESLRSTGVVDLWMEKGRDYKGEASVRELQQRVLAIMRKAGLSPDNARFFTKEEDEQQIIVTVTC